MSTESDFYFCFQSLKNLIQLCNPNFMFQMKKTEAQKSQGTQGTQLVTEQNSGDLTDGFLALSTKVHTHFPNAFKY